MVFNRLTKKQFTECDELSQDIQKIQQSLVKSNFVAKSGNLNFTLEENFVKIISENVSLKLVNRRKEKLFDTCTVPSKLKLTFLTIKLNGKIYLIMFSLLTLILKF